MKKIISLLCAVLFIGTMTPLNVYATGNESTEYYELINLACETFPEYASVIRGDSSDASVYSRVSGNNQIIYSETRAISESETLGINVLSSGSVIVVSSRTDGIEISLDSSSTSDIGGIGAAGTATFKVAYSDIYGEYFKLKNVNFTIYDYSSDYFTDTGTPVTSSEVYIGETSISSTSITYNLTFIRFPFVCRLQVYFDNNQLVASVA